MSRRKLHWKRSAAQAGDVNKIMPQATLGSGEWLSKGVDGRNLSMPSPGSTRGSKVTAPISQRKEQLVRQWCKSNN
jgi:hypothetical protein